MAKPGAFMRYKLVSNNFPRFRRRWGEASASSLNAAGRIGRDEAKRVLAQKQKHRGSQRTQKNIGYRTVATPGAKRIEITTGTLAGVFVEVGATRSHSSMEGYHYLRAGGEKARKALPALVRAQMARGAKRSRVKRR